MRELGFPARAFDRAQGFPAEPQSSQINQANEEPRAAGGFGCASPLN